MNPASSNSGTLADTSGPPEDSDAKRSTSQAGEESELHSRTYRQEIGIHDVLLGRGTGPMDLPGNTAFRALIQQHHKAYHDAKSKEGKRRAAQLVIAAVHAKNGEFLRKAGPLDQQEVGGPDHPPTADQEAFIVVRDDNLLIQKIKQAFRHVFRLLHPRSSLDAVQLQDVPAHASAADGYTVATRPSPTTVDAVLLPSALVSSLDAQLPPRCGIYAMDMQQYSGGHPSSSLVSTIGVPCAGKGHLRANPIRGDNSIATILQNEPLSLCQTQQLPGFQQLQQLRPTSDTSLNKKHPLDSHILALTSLTETNRHHLPAATMALSATKVTPSLLASIVDDPIGIRHLQADRRSRGSDQQVVAAVARDLLPGVPPTKCVGIASKASPTRAIRQMFTEERVAGGTVSQPIDSNLPWVGGFSTGSKLCAIDEVEKAAQDEPQHHVRAFDREAVHVAGLVQAAQDVNRLRTRTRQMQLAGPHAWLLGGGTLSEPAKPAAHHGAGMDEKLRLIGNNSSKTLTAPQDMMDLFCAKTLRECTGINNPVLANPKQQKRATRMIQSLGDRVPRRTGWRETTLVSGLSAQLAPHNHLQNSLAAATLQRYSANNQSCHPPLRPSFLSAPKRPGKSIADKIQGGEAFMGPLIGNGPALMASRKPPGHRRQTQQDGETWRQFLGEEKQTTQTTTTKVLAAGRVAAGLDRLAKNIERKRKMTAASEVMEVLLKPKKSHTRTSSGT